MKKKKRLTDRKTLYFDIEASNLKADCGFMFCFGYMWEDEGKVKLLKISDYSNYNEDRTDDRRLVKDSIELINKADRIVSWYGKGFDIPFIRSKAFQHDLDPFRDQEHIDGWEISRSRLLSRNNRLETVSNNLPISLDLEHPEAAKTHIHPKHWMRAAAGHQDSLDYIYDHCEKDIMVLKNVMDHISKYAKNLPHSYLSEQKSENEILCPNCGNDKLSFRGIRNTTSTQRVSMACTECRHWFEIPYSLAKKHQLVD